MSRTCWYFHNHWNYSDFVRNKKCVTHAEHMHTIHEHSKIEHSTHCHNHIRIYTQHTRMYKRHSTRVAPANLCVGARGLGLGVPLMFVFAVVEPCVSPVSVSHCASIAMCVCMCVQVCLRTHTQNNESYLRNMNVIGLTRARRDCGAYLRELVCVECLLCACMRSTFSAGHVRIECRQNYVRVCVYECV